MVEKAVDLCTSAAGAVSGWVLDIFEKTGAGAIYLGILVAFLCIRFFLLPIFGRSIGSDIARSSADRKQIDSASYHQALPSGSSDSLMVIK